MGGNMVDKSVQERVEVVKCGLAAAMKRSGVLGRREDREVRLRKRDEVVRLLERDRGKENLKVVAASDAGD